VDDDLEITEITEEQWRHAKRGQRAGRVFRVPLALLRKTHRKTQVDVSEAMSATQGEISRLESRELRRR
jgi:hypothetical protein